MPPVFRQGHDQSRCQDPTRHHPVRGDVGPEPRASSASSILDLAAERRVSRSLLRSRDLLAPLLPDSFDSSSSRTRRRLALSHSALVCLSARLGSVGKMLLTDLCNRLTIRALVNRSITEHTTCVVPTPQALPLVVPGAETPNANERSSCVAPDRLSTIRPRLVSRLTARSQLQPVATRCAVSSSLESETSGRPCGCPPHRSVVFSDEAVRPTSDVPCRPRRFRFPDIAEDQDRFHRPLVKTNDLVRPETPSIDRCSLTSAFAPAISE